MYTPLQKYWNSEANSFIFAVDWKHLGLTSKYEYETRDQHFSFYFQVFISGSDKQLRKIAPFVWTHPFFMWAKVLEQIELT